MGNSLPLDEFSQSVFATGWCLHDPTVCLYLDWMPKKDTQKSIAQQTKWALKRFKTIAEKLLLRCRFSFKIMEKYCCDKCL